jgi:segregation and condensation protein A
MAYEVRIEKFEGPLDLLLQLVEKQEMEITNISLVAVTEPFVQHIREHQGKIAPEDLADFLVVAAKLVYLKSKALLPDLSEDLDEGPDLETQLRMYKAFAEAAKQIGEIWNQGREAYARTQRVVKQTEPIFSPPQGVTPALLKELYERAAKRLEPILNLPKAAIERAITIEEKIEHLRARVSSMMQVSFHRFLADSHDKSEMVVGFLALLELIKQRIVRIEQGSLFEDIRLHRIETPNV